MKEFIQGFKVLNQTRSYGMAACPINLSEIKAYLELYGATDPDAFIEYVLKMDEAYLGVKAKKASSETQGPPALSSQSKIPNGHESTSPDGRQRRIVARNGR